MKSRRGRCGIRRNEAASLSCANPILAIYFAHGYVLEESRDNPTDTEGEARRVEPDGMRVHERVERRDETVRDSGWSVRAGYHST